jgi:dihydropteroate synthase
MVRADARLNRGALTLRGTPIRWGARTYVMGIVNVTPDSFSGDGTTDAGDATARGVAQWNAGADVIDVGGESTRPGHQPIDESVEIARVVPVVRALRRQLPNAPISIDTYKPAVLRAAHAAGADLVNSVWGLSNALLEAVSALKLPVVVMHNQRGTDYDGPVVDSVLRYLEDCAARALSAGIAREAIVLDPNIVVLRELDRLVALGFPTMLGTSRKSTLGKLTGRHAADRVNATVATSALAVKAGIDIVRVHDVAAARDAVGVADAVVRDWRPAGWTE